METKKRSVVKAVSYRLTGTVSTVLISLAVTGSAGKALAIGGIEAVTKIVIYYYHERAWGKVQWGKREPDYQI